MILFLFKDESVRYLIVNYGFEIELLTKQIKDELITFEKKTLKKPAVLFLIRQKSYGFYNIATRKITVSWIIIRHLAMRLTGPPS